MGKITRQGKKHKRLRESDHSVREKKSTTEKKSTQKSETARWPANEKRQAKAKDVRTSEPTKQEPQICYLCGCEISPKQQIEYTCPKCGHHACSVCIEIMNSFNNVCLACENRTKKLKAILNRFVFVGIIVAIIILLVIIITYYIPNSHQIIQENISF